MKLNRNQLKKIIESVIKEAFDPEDYSVKTYEVKKGDTLSKIASNECPEGCTSDHLQSLNDLKDPNKIKVGQKIKVYTTKQEKSKDDNEEDDGLMSTLGKVASDAYDYVTGGGDGDEEDKEIKPISSASDVRRYFIAKGIIKEDSKILVIDGSPRGLGQYFDLYDGSNIILEGKVSTGGKGIGNEPNSGQTSAGLMQISAIKGKGEEKGTVLVGLKPTNPKIVLGDHVASPREGHSAEVTSRALTLKELEEQNKNVASRFVYIHGTNRKNFLGQPASGGCIRVSNDNAIKLADELMTPGDFVYVYSKDFTDYIPSSLISKKDIERYKKQAEKGIDKATSMAKNYLGDYLEETNKNSYPSLMSLYEDTSEENKIKVGGKTASSEEAKKILDKYPKEPQA